MLRGVLVAVAKLVPFGAGAVIFQNAQCPF